MSDTAIHIEAPGGFAPVVAIGHNDGTGSLALVSTDSPLPTLAIAPAAPAPLEGTTASQLLAGPYAPAPLSPVYVTLAGEWQGKVTLLRSTDGGATLHPLTLGGTSWGRYTGNACEAAWVESDRAATLYLRLEPDAGAIAFRVSQ